MSKATKSLPRRAVLAGVATASVAAALSSVAVADDHLDAELLRLFAEWQASERDWDVVTVAEDNAKMAAHREYPPEPQWPTAAASEDSPTDEDVETKIIRIIREFRDQARRGEDEKIAAELEARRAEWEAACRVIDARYDVPALTAALEAVSERQERLNKAICAIPAKTPAGAAAKLYIGINYACALAPDHVDRDTFDADDIGEPMLCGAWADLQRMAGTVS